MNANIIMLMMALLTLSTASIADNSFLKTKNKSKSEATTKTPIEEDSEISDEIKGKNELIQALASAVKLYGYRCDSISAVTPFVMSRGYTLICNGFRYRYQIEDKGGRMDIKVD